MECGQCYPSQPIVVLTVDQFVGHGGGPRERQSQNSHVYRKTGILPLFCIQKLDGATSWQSVKANRISKVTSNSKPHYVQRYVDPCPKFRIPIQFENEKRILKFGPVFKEKREKEKAWSEFEFCLPTDEEK